MTVKALLVAGIDIGAATAKAVVLNETKVISSHVMPTGENVKKAAESVMREALGKAGAYGIQGQAAAFVVHLEGSYSGVVGLPLCETAELLKSFGIVTP